MQPSHATGIAKTVNGYRILGKLGSGGMGVVYKARDPRLDRVVALKFLPPQVEADQDARDQLLREARAASGLDHPNVGAIHAIEQTPEGISFIVLGYYEGETLAERLVRGPLPRGEAIEIARQIGLGLAEAHSHGIVHRDIKPSNIIVTRQGVPKIVDFGLARAIQNADSTASTTLSGTFAYMSPEQALGKPLDQRTDLWSLGVVLVEMLTGRLPFEGRGAPAVLYAVAHAAPAHLSELPPGIEPLARRALAKDPAERYSSAEEFAAELARLEEPGVRAVVAPPPRRYRTAAAIALLGVALLAVPLVRQRVLAPAGPREKHIAVLPFTVLGMAGNSEPLTDGLMETLTSRLSNLEGVTKSLWVVPASEVRSHRVTDANGALKTFGATLVVTGTLQRTGQNLRLLVNLVDTRRLAQIGSEEVVDRNGDFSQAEAAAVARLASLMNLAEPQQPAPTPAEPAPAAYESYLRARGLLGRWDRPGNIDQAIGLLRQATQADPGFALAFGSLGEAYLLKYRTDRDPQWLEHASAECEHAVAVSNRLAPIYVILGRIHMDTAKMNLALEEFQRALELNPRDADALLGLAGVYETQSRYADAEQALVRARDLRPDFWVGYSRLGGFYSQQHRYPEAVRQFQTVVDLTPDNAVGWQNLGTALRRAGRLEEAATAFHRSITISPSYAALANLGNLLYQEGRFAEAAERFRSALDLNDKDYRPWSSLGNTYRWLGRPADAERCYRRALPLTEQEAALHPADAVLQARLGLAYLRNRDRTRAFSHLRAALALAPRDAEVLSAMAEGYEGVGDRKNAIVWLRKAVAAGQQMQSLRNDPVLHRVVEDPDFQRRSNQ